MPQIFNPNEDYILEDDGVLLRPLKEEDFIHLLPFALKEPNLWKYCWISAAGERGLKNYLIDKIIKLYIQNSKSSAFRNIWMQKI